MTYTASTNTVSHVAGPAGFEMFARYAGPSIFSGPREIVNDAQRHNYRTLGYVLRGQSMSDTLKNTPVIQDTVLLDYVSTTETYRPGVDRLTYSDPQTGVEWSSNWRYAVSKMIVRDNELISASGSMTQEARFQVYKDLLFAKKQNVHTGFFDFMEERYWAVPNKTTMEGVSSTTKEPYSIPAAINEHTNGLFPSYTPGGAWTTFQGIDPTAYSRWAPQKFTYGAGGAGYTANNIANVISTLDYAMEYLDINPPPVMKEYYEDPNLDTTPRPFIACSPTGKQKLKNLYRAENDQWDNFSDPWNTITYNGMSLVSVWALATAALYPNTGASALTTETSADLTGPRYYIINPRYWRSVFHTERYMQLIDVARTPDDPEAKAYPYVTYMQNVCRSRWRQGILTPSADN